MRRTDAWASIGAMRWNRRKDRRSRRVGIVGLEITGALSAASQMALLYPPGCDEWIRRELAGEGRDSRRAVAVADR